MSPITVQTFLSHLRKSGLVSDARLDSLQSKTAGKSLAAAELSETLVKQKLITPWQAKQLLKGETGFILQQYQLLNPIGRGGMGHVFRGRDSRSEDIVAVKVMAKKLTSNKTLVSRFRREIRASSRLNSPHIVKSLDAGRVGKVDFMVMEFVNGDQIDRVANVLQRVPTGLACEIVRQAAVGLQHAHEHGMVHRDIKPANLMLNWSDSGEGLVKLMDMGLVLLTNDDTNENTVTRAGQVMGTPDFMSPEQGWDTATVDIRSDIYGLGCTLYRLLTGTVPFAGTNPLQVLSQRLQRDALSVQSVCSDIPDEVAAIVSRMTLRDPMARYQHPSEVADALAAVSEPLTRQALKTAARNATDNPNANADFGKGSDEEVDESDGTYRQFLREVQDGSAVNLMLSTGTSAHPAAETMPALDLNIKDTTPTRTNSPRRGQKTGFVVMGTALVALIGLLIFVFSQTNQEPILPVAGKKPPPIVVPDVIIVESPPQKATTGKRWTHKVQATFSDGPGIAGYRLGTSAPPEITVSPDGELVWDVPLTQTPATYNIDVILTYDQDGVTHELEEFTLPLKVVPGFLAITLPNHQRQLVISPEEVFSVSAATESQFAELFDLKYRLDEKKPTSLLLNSDTGLISWTPTANDIGRHQFTISVYDQSDPEEQQTATYRVLVQPSKAQHVLPEISTQQAIAGETFRMALPRPPSMRSQRLQDAVIIIPGPSAPAGLSINQSSNELVWEVPANASGRIDVPLLARFISPEDGLPQPLEGQSVLSIDVAEPTNAPNKMLAMPPEEEIAAAVAELESTLSRTLSQARTSSNKAELARRLVEQSVNGEAGVPDAALLSFVESELAIKAKATDVLLHIAMIRKDRYGVAPNESISQTLGSMRRTSLNPLQQDLTIERCLHLARQHADEQDFQLTQELLEGVSMLLGRSAKGAAKALQDDVEESLSFAKLLVADGTNTVAATELSGLLNRWQFKQAFSESTAVTFVQLSSEGSDPAVQDNGRSAWTTKSGQLDLATKTAPVDVGIIMEPSRSEGFALRFELLPESNCAHVLFGVSGNSEQQFNAYRMGLSQSDTGALQSLRPRATLARPKSKPILFDDQSNLVEVVVSGTQVSARINGVLISQADIPGLSAGRIGFLADLRIPTPQIAIRNVRILLLPDMD